MKGLSYRLGSVRYPASRRSWSETSPTGLNNFAIGDVPYVVRLQKRPVGEIQPGVLIDKIY